MNDERTRRQNGNLPLGEHGHVGAALAAARESAGLTVPEIAERIHIKENHLNAIESMDRDLLPARAYAIGFIKSYAEALDLDSEAVVRRFKEELDYTKSSPVEVEKFEAAAATAEPEPTQLSIWALFAVFAFILWCAWMVSRPSDIVIPGPVGGIAPVAQTPAGEAIIEPAASPATVAIDANVVEATIIERIDPVYPMNCAPAANASESVVVGYIVTASGRVSSEKILQSSNSCFESAALNAIRRWQFNPRTINGDPRPVYDQKYSFSFQRPL